MKREIVRPTMIADMIVSLPQRNGGPVTYHSFVLQSKGDSDSWGSAENLADAEGVTSDEINRRAQEYLLEQVELFPVTEHAPDKRVTGSYAESIKRVHIHIGIPGSPNQQEPGGCAPKIELPPGHQVAAIASFILTKGAYQRYVAPHIADMQFEYIDALGDKNERRARWVRIRGYGLIVWALFGSILRSLTALLLVKSTK